MGGQPAQHGEDLAHFRSLLTRSSSAQLLDRVWSTLTSRGLLHDTRTVLVACSGGPDSQVLLHVMHALRARHGCSLAAASVNHGLRPDAQNDVEVAGRLAQSLGIPFFALQVTVEPGASRQASARRARYAALAVCAREVGAGKVAVGHTLDDQAETVVSRLIRGTSVEGLAGIAAARQDGVIRPLLDTSRAAVRDYVAENQLEHVSDPSNFDSRYLRVRVRHQILPLLERENPRVAEQLASLAEDASEAAETLAMQADLLVERAKCDIAALRFAPGVERRRALKRWAEAEAAAPLHRQHVVALERMLSVGGEVRLPGGVVARLEGERLVFEPVSKRGRGQQRRNEEPS